MTCHTKEELEEMLFDVVNELDLSDLMLEEHGPRGTPTAELVRLVLERKDMTIGMLRRDFIEIQPLSDQRAKQEPQCKICAHWKMEDAGTEYEFPYCQELRFWLPEVKKPIHTPPDFGCLKFEAKTHNSEG